jgi:glucokinase
VLGVLLAGGEVRRTLRVPTELGVEGVVASAATVVAGLCDAASVAPTDLAGVGMALPGLVDPATGTVSHAVNLRIDGADVPVGRMLSERLGGVAVAVENDLNAAALGAAAVLRHTDMAYVALGTGLAAGLLLDGRLRRGLMGAAGEVGHLPYRPGGLLCACGQRGCLEMYASGSSLDAAWPSRTGAPSPVEVFAAAADGDARAVAVRDTFVDAAATAVRFLVMTFDVAHVVLGGGVANLGEQLVHHVRRAVAAQVADSPLLTSLDIPGRIELTPPGVAVGAVGAALATRVPQEVTA